MINMRKTKVTQITQSQQNIQFAAILSIILVVGNYFLWIKALFDAFSVGIGPRIFYFVFAFLVCLGFGTLLLNLSNAMGNLADKK